MATRPFIAIQGQWAQLRQVAPSPPVGASHHLFLRAGLLHLVEDAAIVATISFCWGSSLAALMSWLVEPTASASSMTEAGDSGCTSTAASGFWALSSRSAFGLELVVHDAVTLPAQHLGPGLLLDIGAEGVCPGPR